MHPGQEHVAHIWYKFQEEKRWGKGVYAAANQRRKKRGERRRTKMKASKGEELLPPGK
jgi:hypothetical protein